MIILMLSFVPSLVGLFYVEMSISLIILPINDGFYKINLYIFLFTEKNTHNKEKVCYYNLRNNPSGGPIEWARNLPEKIKTYIS